ncbi:MAG TPA: hypothetical protein VD811_06495 [Desulfuromonadales bacterium]|nr:hypothetical protein [Desulfuromonadales bacterium]
MKHTLSILLAMLFTLSLAACATPAHKHSYQSVKCPSCGYQFDSPAEK